MLTSTQILCKGELSVIYFLVFAKINTEVKEMKGVVALAGMS